MKKIILCVLIISFYSCKKDNELGTLKKDIAGTWEMERFVGYPFNQPVLPPGNGQIVVLGEDGLYERKQHDTVVFHGSYSLRKKTDCYQRSTDITFSTNENSSGTYKYIEISDGRLLLSTPNCYQDGGSVYYRRLP